MGHRNKGFEKTGMQSNFNVYKIHHSIPNKYETTAESLLLGNGWGKQAKPDNMQEKEEIKDIPSWKRERETGWACVLRKDFSRPPE